MPAEIDERIALAQAAIGRILRLGSRPFQEGDLEEYERCRAVVMAAVEPRGVLKMRLRQKQSRQVKEALDRLDRFDYLKRPSDPE